MKRYPQRSNTHQLEELSERFFINSLPRNWRSEKPVGDYGVDLQVDIFENDNATGLELLIQLKSSHQRLAAAAGIDSNSDSDRLPGI